MSNPDSPNHNQDGNNFDNGFEKVDPFSPSSAADPQQDDLISSSVHNEISEPDEDLYSASPVGGMSQPIVPEPLISFGSPEPTTPVDLVLPSSEGDASLPEKLLIADVGSHKVPLSPATHTNPPTQSPTTFSAGSCCCFKNIDPRVLELIYWRDLKKTGVVFGSMMVLLLSLAMFSVLSVIAYLSLASIAVTFSFRIYKNILGAVQKSGEGHPFKQYLDADFTLPSDKVYQAADIMVRHVTNTMKELRHLFLIEDMVDSLKFMLLLWGFTYIGAWFNGMTLIILATVATFTLPKVYETHKAQIDQYVGLARDQIKTVFKKLQEKIPMPGKKKQS